MSTYTNLSDEESGGFQFIVTDKCIGHADVYLETLGTEFCDEELCDLLENANGDFYGESGEFEGVIILSEEEKQYMIDCFEPTWVTGEMTVKPYWGKIRAGDKFEKLVINGIYSDKTASGAWENTLDKVHILCTKDNDDGSISAKFVTYLSKHPFLMS